MPRYADILLPLAQPTYTFAVEEDMVLEEGMAVAVPFGARGDRFYAGIVWRLHDRPPAAKRVKWVKSILYEGRCLLTEPQRRFWEWVADYYLCTLGEVMRMALPALMKPSTADWSGFVEAEYHPRMERYLRLLVREEDLLCQELDRLERRAPKQYEALLELAELHRLRGEELVPRRLLGTDATVLRTLEKKGLIALEERERSIERPGTIAFQLPLLTNPQQQALDTLRQGFASNPTALLHGVTGSGKTELYIHLIAETLSRGDDVLMLVPEIALTTQLTERLERIFGSRVTPYHSKLTPQKRTETYLALTRSSGGEFVVGARSALFLPLKRLGLIVVDEEHDASYKQSDPAPRYQARDCAVAATRFLGCRTLLGSATPSLESWTHAHTGKYGLATLPERYGEGGLPTVILSDTLRALRRGERRHHLNAELHDRIKQVLARGEQVMLFQNRRGFSPFVLCPSCGWIPHCPHCNVSLTYHKQSQRLVCHYCGHHEPLPTRCGHCGQEGMQPAGFGTEKISEEIAKLFPEARILRMDRDSVDSVKAFREAVEQFERGEADILVGTQMITKGFDFDRVSLVGILNADNLLHNPDFRASERAFQLMSQVAGRAGRRATRGEVVIQCSDPRHPLLHQVAAHDYESMAHSQLAERECYHYPPYARLIRFVLRSPDRERLHCAALELGEALRKEFGRRVMGPVAPAVDRIREEYLAELLIKIESGSSMQRARIRIRALLERHAHGVNKSVTLFCDVDPQ